MNKPHQHPTGQVRQLLPTAGEVPLAAIKAQALHFTNRERLKLQAERQAYAKK